MMARNFDIGDTIVPKYKTDLYGGGCDKTPTFVTRVICYGKEGLNGDYGYIEYETDKYEERIPNGQAFPCRVVLIEKAIVR